MSKYILYISIVIVLTICSCASKKQENETTKKDIIKWNEENKDNVTIGKDAYITNNSTSRITGIVAKMVYDHKTLKTELFNETFLYFVDIYPGGKVQVLSQTGTKSSEKLKKIQNQVGKENMVRSDKSYIYVIPEHLSKDSNVLGEMFSIPYYNFEYTNK